MEASVPVLSLAQSVMRKEPDSSYRYGSSGARGIAMIAKLVAFGTNCQVIFGKRSVTTVATFAKCLFSLRCFVIDYKFFSFLAVIGSMVAFSVNDTGLAISAIISLANTGRLNHLAVLGTCYHFEQ